MYIRMYQMGAYITYLLYIMCVVRFALFALCVARPYACIRNYSIACRFIDVCNV